MPIQVPVVQTGLEQSIQQAAAKAGKNLRINMGPGAKSIESLSKPLGRLTGKADEFTKSMEAANARVLAFGASVGVIAAVSRGLQELVKTTIEVEKSLANINSILRQTESQLDSFKNQIFDIARNTGQTFDTVAEAALELSRQGLKAEEVTKRLNDALVLSRLSGLSAADSVAGLTAAVNSFSSAGLTTTDVLNKISAAAASAAVSDRDLIEGLKRSGSVAVAAGVQFDELIGIISALQERTSRGGAVIGNSLKTIFTRIQDLEKLQALQDLGVQVTDLSGQLLSSNKIIENLAPTFAKLDQATKVNLADNLVGKFQIAPFLALLEDYNLKVSRSGEVAATSFNATNEAYKRNEALSKTLADAINVATVNLKELANTLGEIGVTDSLKSIIGVFNNVVSNITDILDGDGIGSKFAQGLIKGISSIISGPGLALALVAIGKLLLDFAKFGAGALRTFFGLNKAAEAQKNLQGQIAASLLNDKGIRSAILSIEKQNISEGEKKKLQTQFFTKALNEQLMVMQKMQGIARTIAPGVMAGTASRRGGRAAGGFLPIGAESSDISRGVGGAPASAKPVVIPNFAFGGGRRGTMVANDSEYIVPNYANGGDAIFNQNMASSMGLPANARKVRAASGYIPNFVRLSNLSPTGNLRDDIRILQNTDAKGQFQKPFGALTAIQANRVLNKSRNRRTRKSQAGSKASTVNIDASRYGVASVFPDKKTGNSSTNPTQLTSDLAQAAAAQGIKNIQFKGIQIRSLHDAKQNLEQKKNEFKNQIADLFVNPVAQLGANVIGASFKGNDKADLKAEVDKVKKGKGGVNLFSSSVEGGIFEAAIRLITKKAKGIKAFKQEKDDQMPFDFEEGRGRPSVEFQKTFKFNPHVSKADAKRTASNDAVRTVIAKAFNSKDQRQFLISQIKKTNPSFNPALKAEKAASGYIPNFAGGALEEAIGREKAAGLPVSQIRINQSGKLRNAQNPMGLAVTNTRDEPTGAIPNYARGNDELGSAADRLTNKFFALQGIMTVFGSAVGETGGALGKWTEAATQSAQILFALQAFDLSPGIKLGSKSAAKVTASNVALNTQRFAAGGGNKASKLFSKLGPVAKLFGKMGPFLGKVVGGLGRFVPILGTVLTVFPLINEGFKKLFGEGVFSKIGKALGLIDTPAQKAAKALSELSEKASGALFEGQIPNAIRSQLSNIVSKNKLKASGVNISDEDLKDPKKVFNKTIEAASKKFALSQAAEMGVAFDEKNRGERNPFRKMKRKVRLGGQTKTLDEDQQKLLKEIETDLMSTVFSDLLGTLSKEQRATLKDKTPEEISKMGMGQLGLLDATQMDLLSQSLSAITAGKLEGKSDQDLLSSYSILQSVLENIKQKQESITKSKEKEKEIDLINTANAKARLKSTIELKKFQLANTTEKQKEIQVAKILGTLTQAEIRDKELSLKLENIRIKSANDRLSLIGQEIGKIEGVKEKVKAVTAVQEKLKGLSVEQLNDTEKFKQILIETLKPFEEAEGKAKNIAKRLLEGSKEADKLRDSSLEAAENLGKGLNNASNLRDALSQAANFADRLRTLDESDIKLKAKKTESTIQSERIDLQDDLRQAQNVGNVPAIQAAQKKLADLELKLFRSPESVALREQQAQESAFSTASQIISSSNIQNEAVKQALQQVARGEVVFKDITDSAQTGSDVSESFAEFLKKSGVKEDEIEAITEKVDTSLMNKSFKIVEQIQKVRENSLKTSKEEQSIQEKSLKDARDQLDIDERSVEIRLLRLQYGIEESRLASMAQKKFDEGQLKQIGLSKEAARRRAERIAIEENPNLTPQNAIKKAELERTFQQRMELRTKDDKVINSEFLDNMVNASVQFRDNFAAAFAEGIKSVDSLKDALLNAANQFLQSMTKNFTQKFMDQAAGEGGGKGLFGLGIGIFANGGQVRGGSGNRDDVPAMLMGGEFVMNKRAVQRYGTGFMEALNSGSVRGYARGGQVRDEEGMFTTPGMRGAGPIVGGANLMSFATQTPVALGRDTLTSSGAFLGAESGRFTMFGRRNNPQFQKVQDAKRQAFDLAIKERQAYEQAEAQKVSLGSMLASAAISTLVGAGMTALGGKIGLGEGMSKVVGSSVGNLAGVLTTGAPASGGAFGAAAAVGELRNQFSEKPDLSNSDGGSGSYSYRSASERPAGLPVAAQSSPSIPQYRDALGDDPLDGLTLEERLGAGLPKGTTVWRGVLPPDRNATGGLIPPAGGVDTVPAMLSGGEFVMNAAATRNIGAGNLQALNSGAGVGDNTDLVSKLDELILATEASQSTGEINITVNGSNGTDTQTSGQDTTDQQRQLSERIKVAVKQVIADEQRLGGQLRR